jgi:hypothetical protein
MNSGIAATDGKPEGGDKAKREKKVYDMPGQTKETPDEVWSHFGTGCFSSGPSVSAAQRSLDVVPPLGLSRPHCDRVYLQ